ncbi:MAG: metalloregulator ArsR/SmtB family transcription factor [candidate division Zixibacteria bacterium]
MNMNEKVFSKYFKAFGDPTRLKIVMLLSSKEMSVNDIVDAIGLSQPTISRHLAVLREAEIAVDRREGQSVFYSLNKGSVENCCTGFCDCLAIPIRVSKKKKKK